MKLFHNLLLKFLFSLQLKHLRFRNSEDGFLSLTRFICDTISSHGTTAPCGPGPPRYRGSTIMLSQTHHTRQDSTGRTISRTQRPLLDNTQHSQERDINSPGGFRTHNPCKQAAADLRLRASGHWDRLCDIIPFRNVSIPLVHVTLSASALSSKKLSKPALKMFLLRLKGISSVLWKSCSTFHNMLVIMIRGFRSHA